MKNPLIILTLALSLIAPTVMAQSFDLGTLTPTLDFPEPVVETSTRDSVGINK